MVIIIALVCVGVCIGGVAQRVVGSGFALVVAPLLVLLIQPAAGVLVVSITGGLAALLVFASSARDVQWRRFFWIAIPAVLGVVPGVLLASAVNIDVLKVITGVVVAASLAIAGRIARSTITVTRSWVGGIAGFVAGVLTSSIGVGVTAITAYGVLSRWEQRPLAATLQPFFVAVSASTLVARLLLVPASIPSWSALEWAAVLASLIAGLLIGARLSRVIAPPVARRGMVVIAYAGALSAVIAGIYGIAT